MNRNHLTIRREREDDRRDVEALVRDAFWNVYRPGCLEHYLLHRMRTHPDFISELNLVLEKDGEIIGQNVFVRAAIHADDGREIPIAAMGPICIAPPFQRQGYGKLLLEECLTRAGAYGIGALCFEGNISFYGKSGFVPAARFAIRYRGLAEGADASFFLCKELREGYLAGITGEYAPPSLYFVDEAAAEEFDRSFPPRKRLRLAGQLS